MKSVFGGIFLMLIVAAVAAVGLNAVDTSSTSTFTSDNGSVRLD